MESFETFYLTHRDRVYRSVIALTADQFDAEDCTAEAFTRAFQGWDTVGKHPTPAAWVVRTAVNLHADRRRASTRRLRLAPKLATEESSPAPALPIDPSLMAALRGLPERQRQVVALRILLELSTEETARELGIATGTVGAHLHRALASLRDRAASHEKDNR